MYCATLYLFFIEMMPGRIGRIIWSTPVELGGPVINAWSTQVDQALSQWISIQFDHPIRPPI